MHRTRKRLLGADPTSRQGATNMPPRLKFFTALMFLALLCASPARAQPTTPPPDLSGDAGDWWWIASFGYVRVDVLPDGPFELRLALHGPENIRVWRKGHQVVCRCVRDPTALRMALKSATQLAKPAGST